MKQFMNFKKKRFKMKPDASLSISPFYVLGGISMTLHFTILSEDSD